MHELAVTRHILEIVEDHAIRAEAREVTAIYLVIGQLSSIVDDSIQHYWHLLAEGTLAENATLHFERVPATLHCEACSHEFTLGDVARAEAYRCPRCEGAEVRFSAGDEFYIASIDVEVKEKENAYSSYV